MDERGAEARAARARKRRRHRLLIAVVLLALGGAAVGVALVSTRGSKAPALPSSTQRAAPPPTTTAATQTTARVHGPHRRPVPILMYHVIAPPIAGAPYPKLYVPRDDFAGQMRWLRNHGFEAVTLGRVFDYWRTGAKLPRHPIVVSFDDGYRSQYSNALPVLRALGWPGVLNLEVRNERQPWGLPLRRLRLLVRAGWEIDAHTIDHPDLTTLAPAQLRYEVAGSRQAIRRQLHVPVDFFCYPSGRYDDQVVAAVRAAGYLGATTTRFGLGERVEPYTLKRIRIDGSDGVPGFAAKLAPLAH